MNPTLIKTCGIIAICTFVSACQSTTTEAQPAAAPHEIKGGSPDKYKTCVAQAGITSNTISTTIVLAGGKQIESVNPGHGVTVEQADKANACMAG